MLLQDPLNEAAQHVDALLTLDKETLFNAKAAR